MGEHPAVKVGRQGAAVIHIAALGVVGARGLRGRNDLVVGEHIACFFCTFHTLAGDFRAGAVGAHNQARSNAGFVRLVFGRARLKMHAGHAIGVTAHAVKGAALAHCAMAGGALAQPLVKGVAVDHAHKAIFNRDVDAVVAGRNHARAACTCHQQVVWDFKVFDQARGNGAAAWLDASAAIEQEHAPALLGQIVCRGGARWAAANDHRVEVVCCHGCCP